jgi:NAD(P)-dependent dehydrogenase (short-subunit alcohol dehydrogenase family)
MNLPGNASDEKEFADRRVLVTGATRGMGRAIAGRLAAAAGVVCLSYGVYGWAAFFLVLGALNLAGGSWYITIARSASART